MLAYVRHKMHEFHITVADLKRALVLMIEPTNRCNFRCQGCYNHARITEPHPSMWSLDTYRGILDRFETQGATIDLVDILGGDVSTGPFQLLESYIKEHKSRGIRTLLVSNLLAFSPEQAEALIATVELLKGKWNVGFDQYELQGQLIGRDARTAQRLQRHIRMCADLIRASSADIVFRLDNCLRPSNYLLVGEYLSFCKTVGAVPYIEQLMHVGVPDELFLTPEQVRAATLIMEGWYRDNEQVTLREHLVSPHFTYPCIYLGRSLYVRLNGDVTTCPCTEQVLGNVFDSTLDDILLTDVFLARRLLAVSPHASVIWDNGICASCPDRIWQQCHGGCRGTTEMVYGMPAGLFNSYPDCPWQHIREGEGRMAAPAFAAACADEVREHAPRSASGARGGDASGGATPRAGQRAPVW